ncbi:unnamed protein product [Didymodactylos carnosus]|uniref:Palmitoyltransferase n=1 Tax=Didymodactylos carnosus TaxID=1234261 RepID=A0A814B7S5_9BILA|nr:unnamed protein product [Didymodactylos carnosus]CAF0945077.1 unnamed protein product [Didymodactylos carnosus]CAF3702257.1 unnamed protein product [Didymodactylos carnosus]CAF3719753.1 unnamed protein product [Didymodactylos carnosus]
MSESKSQLCCSRFASTVKRLLPSMVSWCLLLSLSTIYFLFICPSITKTVLIPIAHGILFYFVCTNFVLATFMDPGKYDRALVEEYENDQESTYYKTVEIRGTSGRMKWCQTCQFYRPPRCSHCSICDFCIDTFDHHCPWLNNCVGRRNYRYFIQFLISVLLHMFVVFGFSFYYLSLNRDRLTELRTIMSIVLMIFIVLLTIPICGLTGFHFVLIAKGKTTNEQVTGKFKNNMNPFDDGCFSNCLQTFIATTYPKLRRVIKKKVKQVSQKKKSRKYEVRSDQKPTVHQQNSDVETSKNKATYKQITMTSV